MSRLTKSLLTSITMVSAVGLWHAAARAADYTVASGATEAVSTDLGGSDTLTKDGAGTLQVTVDQSFSGDITLTDGTLILYGNAAAPATVNGGLLMMGGTTGQPITLNAGTLRIGAQRSIPWTSINGTARRLIGTGGGTANATFNFGSAGTFYTVNRANFSSQSQAIVDAAIPNSGLMTDVSDPTRAFQFRTANSGDNASRISSHEGGANGPNTAYISVPAASQKKYVEVQALLGTNTLASGSMDFAAYARYSDAPSSGVSIGTRFGVPLYSAAAGADVAISVGRYNRDTSVYSTDPLHLYPGVFNVDPTKTLTAVGMLRSGGNSNQGGYFALSGLAVNDDSTAFNSDITVTADATLDLSGAAIADGVATLTGQALNLAGGTLTLTRSLGAARDYAATFTGGTVSATTGLAVNSPGSLTISGPLTGAGSIAKTGDGVLTLSGNSTFGSGTLTFGGGTTNVGYLLAASDNAFGGHSTVALASSQGGISGIQLEGGVVIPQDVTTGGRSNSSTTGYVIRSIAGDNEISGTVTIDNPGGGYGFIADAGTLTLAGTVSSSYASSFGARGLSFNGAGDFAITGDMIRTGPNSQDLSVAMNGTGRLVLSGTNTYEGATSVNTGTLLINGDSSAASGSLTVALGATLGGTGTVGGATTVSGTHSPGASPGLQTFVNGLAYDATSTLVWELSANTADGADRGTLYDGLDLTTAGSLVIDPDATISLVFDQPLADATASSVDWSDSFWGSDRQWTIADLTAPASWDGTLFGTLTVGLDSLGASLGSVRPDASFAIAESGGDLVLQYTAVPEPVSLTIFAAGLAAAGGLQIPRRRR